MEGELSGIDFPTLEALTRKDEVVDAVSFLLKRPPVNGKLKIGLFAGTSGPSTGIGGGND